MISFRTTSSLGSDFLGTTCDYVLCVREGRVQSEVSSTVHTEVIEDDVGGRFTRLELSDAHKLRAGLSVEYATQRLVGRGKGREMKRQDRSSNTRASSGCHTVRAIQTVQPFPETGLLAHNSNLRLVNLANRIRTVRGRAYSYVVRTVKLNQNTLSFEQHGSAPNFQGDVLTLCTCKHQMRSRLSAEEWQDDVWIAGFTSRTIHDRQTLAVLSCQGRVGPRFPLRFVEPTWTPTPQCQGGSRSFSWRHLQAEVSTAHR